MTAFFKGRAVSQVDEFLCEGKRYTTDDICRIIRDCKIEPKAKKTKNKKG